MNSRRASWQPGLLPPQYVRPLRAIFNEIDHAGQGFVRLGDFLGYLSRQQRTIVNHNAQQNGECNPVLQLRALPACLQRCAPPNGMLTFERVIAALRLALADQLQTQALAPDRPPKPVMKPLRPVEKRVQSEPAVNGALPHSKPQPTYVSLKSQLTLTHNNNRANTNGKISNHQNQDNYENLETIRALQQAKIPEPRFPGDISPIPSAANSAPTLRKAQAPPAPPGHTANGINIRSGRPMERVTATQPQRNGARPFSSTSSSTNVESSSISPASQNDSSLMLTNGHRISNSPSPSAAVIMRDKSRRLPAHEHEPKRHTYAEHDRAREQTLRHETLMEEEQEILQRGLEAATRTCNWYNGRMQNVQTRKKLITKGMVPLDTAVHEEKLNYLRAHVAELNRRMSMLCESSDRAFPSHINLETNKMPQNVDDQLYWMKQQNKRLTDELADKTKTIDRLQAEKQSLVERAFQYNTNPNVVSAPTQYRPTSTMMTGHHAIRHNAPSTHYAKLPILHRSTVTPAVQATLI